MNATNLIPAPQRPLKRIQLISRAIKALLVIYVLTSGVITLLAKSNGPPHLVFGMRFDSYAAVPATLKIMSALTIVIYLLAVVLCYQLLNLYERGEIFSFANVRIYKRLGLLAIAYGLIALYVPTMRPEQPVLRRVLILVMEAASSSWIIGGVFLVMTSLIMHEACKAHEEQKLTV
jgi:hypothetical protein